MAAPRYQFISDAEIVDVKSGARFSKRTADLSSGGCFLDTMTPLPAGTSVKVRISKGDKTFEALATVRYVLQGMGMGLTFTKVEPDQQKVLKAWLDELGAQ